MTCFCGGKLTAQTKIMHLTRNRVGGLFTECLSRTRRGRVEEKVNSVCGDEKGRTTRKVAPTANGFSLCLHDSGTSVSTGAHADSGNCRLALCSHVAWSKQTRWPRMWGAVVCRQMGLELIYVLTADVTPDVSAGAIVHSSTITETCDGSEKYVLPSWLPTLPCSDHRSLLQ